MWRARAPHRRHGPRPPEALLVHLCGQCGRGRVQPPHRTGGADLQGAVFVSILGDNRRGASRTRRKSQLGREQERGGYYITAAEHHNPMAIASMAPAMMMARRTMAARHSRASPASIRSSGRA